MIQNFSVAVQSTDHDGSLTAVVHGEIDVATAPELDRELEQATARGPGSLVVDLAGVTFLDSSGCHVLVRAHRRGEAAGVGVELTGVNGSTLRVLEVAGLTEVLTVRS